MDNGLFDYLLNHGHMSPRLVGHVCITCGRGFVDIQSVEFCSRACHERAKYKHLRKDCDPEAEGMKVTIQTEKQRGTDKKHWDIQVENGELDRETVIAFLKDAIIELQQEQWREKGRHK